MDDIHCIPFKETGYFSKLICDYLEQDPKLRNFYSNFSDLESFKVQLDLKKAFPQQNREILKSALLKQYQNLNNTEKPKTKVLENIHSLSDNKTFSICTGHQLCLFTGPLYFIYKIVSTINLCEKLKSQYPDFNFVPVYWMASEDHDFEEINHFHFKGEKISWDIEAEGPVGRLETSSLESVLKGFRSKLGPGKNADKIYEILCKAYLENKNLADASRYLVHELFGEKGLIILDADDAQLKEVALPYFQNDLFNHEPNARVEEASQKLAESYFNQIHPREINLFYIENGLRERIERDGEIWTVLNTDIKWTKNELERELNVHPEKFSPNVVLRPFYQELILPNLAYIGGGGELAYWFQLKDMFDNFEIPFPILLLRNSVLGISEKQFSKMEKMGLDINLIFKPLHEIQNSFAQESAPIDPGMKEYRDKIERIFKELEDIALLTDKSMLGAVNAQKHKQLKGMDNLKKKLLRAEKRKNSDLMERIELLHHELFPKGGLQERNHNFIEYYLEYGEGWFKNLYRQLDPLKLEFITAKW
tara:strand:- start:146689 stop:148293 length:1605 start_codon:yes stop_codon:yes gene_type:complete